MDLTALESRCLEHLTAAPGQRAGTGELERALDTDLATLAQVLNGLLARTLIDVRAVQGELIYSLLRQEDRQKVDDLENEEKLVFRFIQQVGSQGIWVRTLANRTNLHQNLLTKALKKLEQRQLVKTVKSVKLGNKKLYMLYDLEPSAEVTGGIWFSEQELDVDFVETIARTCLRYIQQHSFPPDPLSVYSPQYAGYPTLTSLTRYVAACKVSNVALGAEDLHRVLATLEADGLIERLDDDDDEDRFRATRDPQPFHGLAKLAPRDGYLTAWAQYE